MKLRLLIVLLCCVVSTSALATVDTLTAFNSKSALHHYRIPGLTMQVARLMSPAGGTISRIAVLLGGFVDSGSVRIRLFGNEGGAPVPLLQKDLIDPLIIRKTRRGVETCFVDLPAGVRITSHQFFVAVDQMSEGVTLVTDTDRKPVVCRDAGGEFAYQCLLTSDNRWWTGPYGYAISAHIEYDLNASGGVFEDVTSKVGLPDTIALNLSIAWADYNRDSRPDLLTGGRLYRNDGDRFTDVTSSIGLSGTPQANLFLDINNDGRLDILFLGTTDPRGTGVPSLFIAGADSLYHLRLLSSLSIRNPTSFSVADADGDRYVDLFVGQGPDQSGAAQQNLLLINDHRDGFVDRSSLLYASEHIPRVSRGAQWVDINTDGFPDLFVANKGSGECELWRNNGDGSFSMLYGPVGVAPAQIHSAYAIGGHWADYDRDGKIDLLLPQQTLMASLSGNRQTVLRLSEIDAVWRETVPGDTSIAYSELRGSAIWGDVDNDGALDMIVTSGSQCRYADIYLQGKGNRFELATSEYGLLGVAAGPEAVWVDYDNDGLVDLCTFVNGYVRLFRNTATPRGNYVDIDLDGPYWTAAKVEVYAEGNRYSTEAVSGRGLLAQDPPLLHIGIGPATSVDSVVIRWSDGLVDRITDILANTRTTVSRRATAVDRHNTTIAHAGVFPNPFSENVEFFYNLTSEAGVTIRVFTIDGVLVWENIGSGLSSGVHKVSWNGRDRNGERVAQGAYLYRIISGNEERTGQITLIK